MARGTNTSLTISQTFRIRCPYKNCVSHWFWFTTSATSATPIPISFDALSEDPIPLKGCVLWNRRAFIVRIRQTRETHREGGCGYVKNKTLSVTRKHLDERVIVLKHCNVHQFQHICEQHGANLCCPRFPIRKAVFAFCAVIQRCETPAKVLAVRGCAARVWICGTSQNHESHGCSRIQGMRAR